MKIGVYNLTKIIIIALLIDTMFTPISIYLGNATSVQSIYSFFKFPQILIFLSTFFISLATISRGFTLYEIVFLIFGIVGFAKGIYLENFNRFFISHIYSFLIAICGMRAGRFLDFKYFLSFFKKYYKPLIAYLTGFSIIYFLSLSLGLIDYWGISTNLGYIFIILYGLNFDGKLITIFSIILTGKRTPLLASIITLFVYSINRLKNLFSILIGFSGVLFIAFRLGLLERFVNPLKAYDIELSADFFSNSNAWDFILYAFTGGRIFEVKYLLIKFNDFYDWIFGLGFGSFFEMPLGIFVQDETYIQHYTHNSFFSLTMLYGFIIPIIIFALYLFGIVRLLIKKESFEDSKVILLLSIYILLTSLAGPLVNTDCKFWIVLGILYQYLWKPRLK